MLLCAATAPPWLAYDVVSQDVVFAYPTRPSKHILREYNLKIEAGKTLALVGPSGEGKSTIMSLVLRYERTAR